jgi:hypothetical protein
MALTLEDGGKVWQKVRQALTGANPAAQGSFKALREYLVNQKGNPNLQFIAFSDADLIQATGVSPIAVGCTLYGVYFIKNGTVGVGTATDSWLTIGNAATNTVDATKFVALMTSVAKEQVFAIYPNGLIFGTDITITGETSAQDGTESTANDSGSAFIVIGSL